MCGIFGIYCKKCENIGKCIYNKLCLLQHRGQDCAGIVTTHNNEFFSMNGSGLISQIFNLSNLSQLKGTIGLAHNRYATIGKNDNTHSIQPMKVKLNDCETIYFSQNGTIVNCNTKKYQKYINISSKNQSDSEIIRRLLIECYQQSLDKHTKEHAIEAALIHLLQKVPGAYSLIIMTDTALYAMKDRYGIRPLCVGHNNEQYIASSESCVFASDNFRELCPGEIVKIDQNGINTIFNSKDSSLNFCIFELIYFSRPDSMFNSQEIYNLRVSLGKQLAIESAIDVDYIIPVPNSSIPHAIGYSQQTGIPYCRALTRNTNAGRTFILPNNKTRQTRIKMKFTCLRHTIKGKKIVLVDDSIVRGNTIKFLVELFQESGVSEIHVRIACPPIKHPCYMGVDMSTHKELIAHDRDINEINKIIGSDSLEYLSYDGMLKVCSSKKYCTACFTGKYPIELEW